MSVVCYVCCLLSIVYYSLFNLCTLLFVVVSCLLFVVS